MSKFSNKINTKSDNWDSENFSGVSIEAENFLEEIDSDFVASSYSHSATNTYNHESNLSQVLQFTAIKLLGEHYVILQIHGGCDVRGGYTDARLFKLDNEYCCCDRGFLNPEDVYGTIDGIKVDNCYFGHSLTNEKGEEIELNKESKIKLYLAL